MIGPFSIVFLSCEYLFNLEIVFSRYSVADSGLLWSVFENYYFDNGFQLSDQVPFTDFATSWTDNSGYPVINVTRVNSIKFKITQVEKFSWIRINSINLHKA